MMKHRPERDENQFSRPNQHPDCPSAGANDRLQDRRSRRVERAAELPSIAAQPSVAGSPPGPVDAVDGTLGRNPMDIHFHDSRTASAPAQAVFDVITDYASYPRFNRAIVRIEVVSRDDMGAEFIAHRRTRIAKRVRARDRFLRHGDLVVERTYPELPTARSTWTIHAVDDHRSTLTIDASQSLDPLRRIVMRPLLKRLFYSINFTPFIQEAERRAAATTPR
jgi:ribosome-associated toxin RatA of RatAB toxin-antitoxin module